MISDFESIRSKSTPKQRKIVIETSSTTTPSRQANNSSNIFEVSLDSKTNILKPQVEIIVVTVKLGGLEISFKRPKGLRELLPEFTAAVKITSSRSEKFF